MENKENVLLIVVIKIFIIERIMIWSGCDWFG